MGSLKWMQTAITTEFQLRVQAALNYVATEIVNEDTATANHATRMIAAQKLLTGQINIPDFAMLTATDADLRAIIDADSEITDVTLLNAVTNSLVVIAKVAL